MELKSKLTLLIHVSPSQEFSIIIVSFNCQLDTNLESLGKKEP